MTNFEELFNRQGEIVTELQRVGTNFDKDSAHRKTVEYLKLRLDALDNLWGEFDLNNTTLEAVPMKSQRYFLENIYDRMHEYYIATRSKIAAYEPHKAAKPSGSGTGTGTGTNIQTNKIDELLSLQRTNFRAFKRLTASLNVSEISEKWELEDELRSIQARWNAIDKLHLEIDNILEGEDEVYQDEFTRQEVSFKKAKKALYQKLAATSHIQQATPLLEIPTFTDLVMDITYQYTKTRRDCGRQPLFCEQGPEMCDSIPTDASLHASFILRNPVHQLTQNTPCFSECHINTIRAEYASSGANHPEGGWPKDVNLHDIEATERYRRKIQKEDGYIHCAMHVSPGLEHYVLQNNAIDMYRTFYVEMPPQPAVEHNSCRTVNVYRDFFKRPVSSISWQLEGGHHFAVTYVDFADFYRVPRGPVAAYEWDVDNANHPHLTLSPPSVVLDLQYSPRDSNTMVGGLLSGQVAVWDRRRAGWPVGACPPHVAHRDMVRSVLFINSKSGMEFFSGGPDGACKWWDLRDLSEPIDEMIMDVVKTSFDVQSMASASGVSVLEYEPTIPTRFMVGTENGLVIGGNRKGKSPLEKLPAKFEAHLGPVWSLERNPNFLKNFLTVGDWTVRVWSEDCRDSPVLWSPPLRRRITAGTWSPTRLSLMALVGADGRLGLWDLLRRQHEPVLTMQVCTEPLERVRFHEAGALAALGSKKGCIYLVELSQSLTQSCKNDKGQLGAIFEREAKREKILEARLREIRLKQRQAEEGSPAASLTDLDPSLGDKDLAEAGADYMQQVKKELAAMY